MAPILVYTPPRPEDDPPPTGGAAARAYPDPKLPELTLAECGDCAGYGYTGDEYTGRGCDTCDRTGQLEVCSGCGERPWVTAGVEACGCVPRCELCDEPADALNPAGICAPCHEAGVRELEAERSRYATPEAEEIAWGLAVGWLSVDEAAA